MRNIDNYIVDVIAGLAIVSISFALGECSQVFSDIMADILEWYDDAGAYTYPVDPLIFDLNGDGVKTVALADGVHFDFDKNGFAALAYFDTNADGVIDAKDAVYHELQIWQDKNQNGTVDDGELMSLEEASIASSNLAYENINVTDESGNRHSQESTYTRTDGTVLSVEDVWFEKDAA